MNDRQRRYILLDRDGVVNRRLSVGHVKSWEAFEFLPRSLEALHLLALNHFTAIVISRQACGGNGNQKASELDAVTRRFLLEAAISEGRITQVYYCRHRREDGCNCYRANAGLIARAKADHGFRPEETYFVGEQQFDLEAAAASGCPCIRIQRDAFLETGPVNEGPYGLASSLHEAAEQILALGNIGVHEYAAAKLKDNKFGFSWTNQALQTEPTHEHG